MPRFSLPKAPASVPLNLQRRWNALLPLPKQSTNSVLYFSPDHFRRKLSRWVSYYALFKWWLPLSQHPHCLRKFTSFLPLSTNLGTLSDGLGCFPLANGAYPPLTDCSIIHTGIQSLIRFGILVWTLAFSVLYPRCLTLNAIPKYISERTSYYGAWLAFHS